MMRISVIVGSTRQSRFSEKPAQWMLRQLQKREGIEAQLLDLRDFPMPFFDQPTPPAMPGRPPYEHEVVKKWTAQTAPSQASMAAQVRQSRRRLQWNELSYRLFQRFSSAANLSSMVGRVVGGGAGLF